MIDFTQWIDVPDSDQPALLPEDDDVLCGLKDLSSLGLPSDLHIDHGSGLLLVPADEYGVSHGTETLDAIDPSVNAGQNAFFLSSSPNANLFPPALSPDCSPTSIASSPWPRTPEIDSSHANVVHFTPVDALWEIGETEEPCSTIHFLDQSGNNLEDIRSQVEYIMPEDIACTPQFIPDTSFTTTPLGDMPTFMVSSPPSVSISPRTDAVLSGKADCMSLPHSPSLILQSLFSSSLATDTPLHGCSLSPSLSPLTPLSFLIQSPSMSPNPSPLINSFPLSPAPSSLQFSNSDEEVGVTDPVPSVPTRVTTVKLRAKRNADTLNEDAPILKLSRPSRAKNVDEEEWNPESERVKRPRGVSSSQSSRQAATTSNGPLNESWAASQGSEGHSDTTCHFCGQAFTRASDYVRHVQNSASHPETRKVWPCPYCDSTLGRKDALGRHVKALHPGKPVFIPEGSQSSERQKRMSVRRIPGQRKMMPLRRQSSKATRR
ncbi:hypothetical protein L210DRAFT_3091046 [Boletus edulis BED1]|uniref:C2H2-type domain-containing protein n=1 Tax=Boletus edulis BED1 TaxID=1328754 RepID=A0AAD4BZ10_BOLED|nr:hypothetical protein L210DRAFT_3091046 [Boletus edulis BED1]